VVPKATRELTVPNAMKEEFILGAIAGASGRKFDIELIKKHISLSYNTSFKTCHIIVI
jgi:hypothetical protein